MLCWEAECERRGRLTRRGRLVSGSTCAAAGTRPTVGVLELKGLLTHVALGMWVCGMMAWIELPGGGAVDFVRCMRVVVGGCTRLVEEAGYRPQGQLCHRAIIGATSWRTQLIGYSKLILRKTWYSICLNRPRSVYVVWPLCHSI